jgi:hypothetical protein
MVLFEVDFYNQYHSSRNYLEDMGVHILILRKFNLALRFSAFAGVFATVLFYRTARVLWLNIIACLLNIATQSLIIDFETSDQTRVDLWESDTDKYGSSPIWFLYLNLSMPVVSTGVMFYLFDLSGLVLHQQDSIFY